MAARGYEHLILAGHPSATSQVYNELPKRLQRKLLDAVPASSGTRLSDVVETTLASFIEAEEQESRATAAELVHQLRRGGLAVAGTRAIIVALPDGRIWSGFGYILAAIGCVMTTGLVMWRATK
jgi:hypothetical protein